MPSPFPGMNPYLESSVWHDFHFRFITHMAETLVPQIRPDFIAKLESNVYIHELSAEERLLGRPDVAIGRGRGSSQPRVAASAVAAPTYARVSPPVDIERDSFIEIRERESMELITVIELLSPSNKKSGGDREQYAAKRRQLLASSVHFVELDFLRGGPRMPLEDLPDCDYYALVSLAEERPRVGIWPLRLRDKLPHIPIPLRAPHPDASLDLQQLLNRVYDAAGYEDHIYDGKPQPPLHPDDAIWAQQLTAQFRQSS